MARSEDLHQSLAGINRLINDEETQELGEHIITALEELRAAATEARALFKEANESVDVLTNDLKPVFEKLAAILDETEQILSAAKSQLKGDSDQLYQLGSTLEELERAAKSVREFFDYMERNPESMLRGKSE